MDRGPYGKYDADGKWFNSATDRKRSKIEGRPPRKGSYRAVIDMGHKVTEALGSNGGTIKVRVKWWRKNELAGVLDQWLVK